MNITLVADRYANALFELSVQENVMEEVYADSKTITETCAQSKDLRLMLKSPVIFTDKKLKIIHEIFGPHLHKLTMTYLLVMIRKKREKFIPEIAKEMVEKYKDYNNILTVHFKSPVKPDADVRKKVLELMTSYTKSDIDLSEEIDASLIGGFVLSWKDKQYDASIRKQIDDLKKGVAKVNLYKKGF
jgi:F-type H+-transporting ATPase subunit delta